MSGKLLRKLKFLQCLLTSETLQTLSKLESTRTRPYGGDHLPINGSTTGHPSLKRPINHTFQHFQIGAGRWCANK